MLEENKNLKDSVQNTPSSYRTDSNIIEMDTYFSISYIKTKKLITALYMVTDMIDKDEPLRNKLRTLGGNLISDIYSFSQIDLSEKMNNKILEIVSFLDILSAIGMISEMNCNILKKEFFELKKVVNEIKSESDLLGFFTEDLENNLQENLGVNNYQNQFSLKTNDNLKNDFVRHNQVHNINGHEHKGHQTRIGVQKGSTLMKALNEVKIPTNILSLNVKDHKTDFNELKKQRRDEIVKIIKEKNGATITDIKNSAKGVLLSCGEKTLQRELISMVHNGVLYKIGEKRWSRYFLSK